MSEVKKCPNCNSIDTRGGKYCSQCGHDLTQVQSTPQNDYIALRITSVLIVIFGWLIIIISLFASAYYYSRFSPGTGIVHQGQSDMPSYDPNSIAASPLIPAAIALFGVTSGMLTIASGQVFMVLLDVRDDVRSMRLQ